MSAPHALVALCAPGLEPLLTAELAPLGALDIHPGKGRVHFRGHRRVWHRVLLEAGLASDLRVDLGAFEARSFATLAAEAGRLPWERWLHPGVGRRVRVRTARSRLYHTAAIEERLLEAVAQRLRDGLDAPDPSGLRLELSVVEDQVRVALDLAGAPLHRRGYRLATGKAPLREDLARALVVASGWDPRTPFVDPFCGSGTVLLEAARVARRIPPGWGRPFDLTRSALFHPRTWTELRAAAEARVRPAPAPLLGADRVAGALDATRANAARAEVAEALTLEEAPVGRLVAAGLAGPHGAVVTNPPYGPRLARKGPPHALYGALRRRAARFGAAWHLALLVRRGPRPAALRDLDAALGTLHGGLALRVLVGKVGPR